jgi:hypothetical protein
MPTGVGARDEVRRSAGVGRSQNNILPEITGVPSSSNVLGAEEDDHDNAENADQDSSHDENETEDNTITHDDDSVNREMDARYGPRNREGDKICMMTRLACNRAIESSYWRMDNNSDVGLLTGYVLYRLPIELEFMDLDTFSR